MTIEAIKLFLLTLSVSTSSVSTIYSNDSSEYSIQTADLTKYSVTPIEGAEYICKNLYDFEKSYNEFNPDLDPLTANSVENLIPLFIESQGGQIKGILIDLNDECGYITIGYDYEIFDIQSKGNQPFYDYSGYEYFFSTTTGYSFYDTDLNDWVSINKENISEEKDWENVKLNHGQYKGQEKDQSGNGKIVDTLLYVHDKYGYDYYDYYSASLDMDGYQQYELSAYKTVGKDNGYSSEGNCWIVSAFNVLQYIAKTKYTNMYFNYKVGYDAKQNEPNIYSKHFDNDGNCKEKIQKDDGTIVDKWELTNYSFPLLYGIIREYVDGKFKKCDDGYIWETKDIIKYMCTFFGNSIDIDTHYDWFFFADYIVNEIINERPALWFTLYDTYGSHAMAVCGYKYYKRERKFGVFTFSTFKLFYELKDGHSTESRWFDISGFNLNLGCLVFFKY